MAAPIAIAAVAIAAVGVIANFLGSKKAAKAARKQAEEEARLERMVTGERLRQIDKEERTLYGETVAGYAGGGVLSSFGAMGDVPSGTIGSPQAVLSEQATEFGFERDITRRVGATKVAQGLARGRATAQAYKYQGYSNSATGISNILANYATMNTPTSSSTGTGGA